MVVIPEPRIVILQPPHDVEDDPDGGYFHLHRVVHCSRSIGMKGRFIFEAEYFPNVPHPSLFPPKQPQSTHRPSQPFSTHVGRMPVVDEDIIGCLQERGVTVVVLDNLN